MKPQTAVLPGLAAMVLALLLPTASPAAEDPAPTFLTAPFLQLPEESSVRVVWFTNFEGSGHGLAYGDDLSAAAEATTIRMTRMLEDADSRLADRAFEEVSERPVWRHEALATGLAPGKRVPYRVRSVTAAGQVLESDSFTLKPAPQPGEGLKILLTSDQQNRQMSPANFQKVVETFGKLDAVFFAGDLVDHPRRASEWFDRFDPSWRDDGPDYRRARPPFFPALQGTYRQLFPAFPYRRGGEILQHAPLIDAIGNHEVSGRYRPNETVVLGGRSNLADINFM